MVPTLLRKLFILHFIIDFIFAIPLKFAPKAAMALMGWPDVEPVASDVDKLLQCPRNF